jgi:phosphatidylglycerophosphate synthase
MNPMRPKQLAADALGAIDAVAVRDLIADVRADGLAPADWVTLARAVLAMGVATVVADSFRATVPVVLLVSLAAVALVLDAVDGWVARRTRTTAAGARLDGEVDAFLILVLSLYVAHTVAAWVLAIGAARYAFLAAGWVAAWMRAPLPPRYWRKVVAAAQGIALTVAAASLLSPALTTTALFVALGLLAESFGRDGWWLWINRQGVHAATTADADLGLAEAVAPANDKTVTPVPGDGRDVGRDTNGRFA